jgi:hypothetical protein
VLNTDSSKQWGISKITELPLAFQKGLCCSRVKNFACSVWVWNEVSLERKNICF